MGTLREATTQLSKVSKNEGFTLEDRENLNSALSKLVALCNIYRYEAGIGGDISFTLSEGEAESGSLTAGKFFICAYSPVIDGVEYSIENEDAILVSNENSSGIVEMTGIPSGVTYKIYCSLVDQPADAPYSNFVYAGSLTEDGTLTIESVPVSGAAPTPREDEDIIPDETTYAKVQEAAHYTAMAAYASTGTLNRATNNVLEEVKTENEYVNLAYSAASAVIALQLANA